VAKAVRPAAERQFRGGLAVASAVEAAGIPTGAPVPTVDGRWVADVGGRPVALLRWVDGVPLVGDDPAEQQLIGSTLGRVHCALRRVRVTGADRFHWLDTGAAHLGIRPWLRERVAAAVAALDDLDPATLTAGLLHGDPAPEAFRHHPGQPGCGLIDWSVALCGPVLYDLASAVMYVGGPSHAGELIEAYLAQEALGRAEVDRGLPVMLRFRWAVQADYFAHRIVTDDRTGIESSAGNEKGLADARAGLG
jgi:homoserine kinase type II